MACSCLLSLNTVNVCVVLWCTWKHYFHSSISSLPFLSLLVCGDFHLHAFLTFHIVSSLILPLNVPPFHPFTHHPRLYREEECEDGIEDEEEEQTPGTESDSDEQEVANTVPVQTFRYFRT